MILQLEYVIFMCHPEVLSEPKNTSFVLMIYIAKNTKDGTH